MSEIFQKIPLIMAEIGAIGKGRTNSQQGYKFRGIDDVYNAVNTALSKHGVFCAPTVLSMKREERQTAKGGTLLYTILNVKYTFYASDGSNFESITVGEAMDSGDKSCNKAMSAAQKYAFFQVFSIPTEEPKDTENETYEVKDKKSGAESTQPPTPQGAATPPSPASPKEEKTSNYKFLETVGKEKERVGEDAYYRVIGNLGYEHANQITDKDTQTKFWKELKILPSLPKLPKDCMKGENICEHSFYDEKGAANCKPLNSKCPYEKESK